MRRYLEHIKSKEPHERRQHALAGAAVITGIFFVAWLVSFGARLGATAAPAVAQDSSADQTAASALAPNATGGSGQAQLQISTTSVYSY